jgi:hypothetical protein
MAPYAHPVSSLHGTMTGRFLTVVARPQTPHHSNPLTRAATVKNRSRPLGLAVYSAPADSVTGTQSRSKPAHRGYARRVTATIQRPSERPTRYRRRRPRHGTLRRRVPRPAALSDHARAEAVGDFSAARSRGRTPRAPRRGSQNRCADATQTTDRDQFPSTPSSNAGATFAICLLGEVRAGLGPAVIASGGCAALDARLAPPSQTVAGRLLGARRSPDARAACSGPCAA